jgi:hypothetical protein
MIKKYLFMEHGELTHMSNKSDNFALHHYHAYFQNHDLKHYFYS